MMNYVYAVLLMFAFCTFCKGQGKTDTPKDNTRFEADITSRDFNSVTRNIIQDRKGNIWIATFSGVFKYDGKSFTNMTSKVSSARFFSLLEDRKGNFWFGSIGSGVYSYDGKTFRNFTTKDGLVNDEIGSIYEDKAGNIWFGASRGASRFDGKSIQNYTINGEFMNEDKTGESFSERQPYEVTSIIEDKRGKLWFGTRGNTFVYDGKTFTRVTNNFGKPFTNVRTIIEDKKGNIWLAGQDGLWRYQGSATTHVAYTFTNFGNTFTHFTEKFVGYVYEDAKGNIWTSGVSPNGGWALSRYDGWSLSGKMPTVTEIKSKEAMIFGILEDDKGHIWFGAGGVYRYDGNTITDFKESRK